ncbi:MAG: DUF748 domain-containing protein [Methylococcales bacterium]|nr:DUF748 domain-containing protein [Methylococcales bacterium]
MEEPIISAKTKKILLWITGLLITYSLLGFLVLPAVLKNQIPKITKENLNRESQIKDIEFNPFSMELNLHEFDLNNLDKSSFVSFKRLNVNLAVLKSIANLTLTVDQIMLDQPNTLIKRNKQGKFNFSDLLSTEAPKPEEESDEDPFPITIVKTVIAEGKINWDDDFYSNHQKETIYPLNLNLDKFTTVVGKQSELELALALESGGKLDWKGDLELTPLNSTGKIKLNKVDFNKVWQLFLQDSVNFKIVTGSELVEIDYHLTDTEKGLQFLIKDASLSVDNLNVSEKNLTEPVISVPDFKISGITFDLLKKSVAINEISAVKAQFKAWLDSEGIINYQPLFSSDSKESQPQQKSPTPNTKEEPWTVTLNKLNMSDFSFNFIDKSLPSPATIDLTSLNLSATELSNKPGATLPFNLDLKINKSGGLKIGGSAILDPFSSQLKVNADNIALKDFQPYIDTFARLDLISGLFNLNADVSLLQENNKPFDVKLKADSHINDLVTRDQLSNKDFLNWKKLDIEKFDLDLAANSYLIDSVKLDKLYTRVLIRKNKTMNINDILITKDKKEEKPVKTEETSTKKEVKPTYKIANFSITNSVSDFSDRSLILPFSAHINKLKGTVKGISSDQNALIKVALNGQVANIAPVTIKGNISPQKDNSNISLDFKSMPLPVMTPYMAEFAGRKIEKGNMSLKLKYDIKNNKLSASNNLLIDQLVLGESVDNPDAVSLPLDLAIALLADSDGKIKLDMPITGSLDDPQFSVSGLIFDTLVNVLTKIISSPFNAVASIVGSDEDISKITFLPGESLLDDKQKEKLEGLATALVDRPALKLEIKGAAFSKEDWPQLQVEALGKQLLKMRAEELSKKTGETVLTEHLKYSKDENQRLLADLFIKTHPKLADRSIFGTPRLINSEEDNFYEVAQSKMAEKIKPNNQRLEKLAVARAQSIAKFLSEKKIAIERIYVLNVVVDPKDSEGIIASSLNLTAN